MPSSLNKLRGLLAELFQLDQADLDFGIYRIINHKRDELVRFLNEDLQSQTSEVFSHLYAFFRRYYCEGDSISPRRYRQRACSIPYDGEEVRLHWANADQYFVKSSDTIREYVFKVPSGRRVRFQLMSVAAEPNNNRPPPGKERRLILHALEPLREVDGELSIRFEYRTTDRIIKQVELNQQTITTILAAHGVEQWLREFNTLALTPKKRYRTVLEKHLAQYTARRTFDSFIHKDLGGFLRRELDFYLKNEVLHLHDSENQSTPGVEQCLSQVKVICSIAHKVIRFLQELEDLQKTLWLKAKFVVETQYCITLGRVPVDLYPEIARNEAQRQEWVALFAIDEIKNDRGSPAYTVPLTVEFLRANPNLVLDTAHFSRTFRDRLLASFDNLDETFSGLVIDSDNFQALRLLAPRLQGQVDVVFADPPYNTGVAGSAYKDSYPHSSWLSMIENRLAQTKPLLKATGLLFLTIDFVEVANLRLLCDSIFGPHNFLADIAWEKRYTRSNNAKRFYSLKDTVLCYRASEAVEILREARSEKSRKNYTNPDNDPRGPWISSSYVNPATKARRPNLVYPIRNPITGQEVEHPTHAWKYDRQTHQKHIIDDRLYWGPEGSYLFPRLKSFLSEAREGMVPTDIWHHRDTGTTDEGGKILKALFGRNVFDNPKPPSLVQRAISLTPENGNDLIVLDPFAGSGTTAQAVIDLNRMDDGNRRFVLVEMGWQFDSVLLPRIKKVIYSADWDAGKPTSRLGVSHGFKYVRLESYEDTLNNLEVTRSTPWSGHSDADAHLREDYLLSYSLDLQCKGRPSFLNVAAFRNPDRYTLKVERNGLSKLVEVDFVETFNWLLGLRVKRINKIEGVRVVAGTSPTGERVLVLWRNRDEMDNDDLERWFDKQGYGSRNYEYDLIYVNGDNNLETLRRSGQTWQVRRIEEEFQRRMFAGA